MNTRWPALVAVAPILALSAYAIATASFAFLDDAVTVDMSRQSWATYFQLNETGRVFPLYWIALTLPLKIFGEHPWALQLTPAIAMVTAVALLYGLVRRISGPTAGVAASWLATFTLPAAESLFTLSKGEPSQLALWLSAIACTTVVAASRSRRYAFAAGLLALGAMLTKETGILFVAPVAILLLPVWCGGVAWPWRERVSIAALMVLPLLVDAAVVAYGNLQPSSYVRSHVLAQNYPGIPALTRDLQAGVLMLAGLVFGAVLVFRSRSSHRTLPLLFTTQLAVLVAFFCYLPYVHPYYLLVPSFFAAGLIGAAVGTTHRGMRIAAVCVTVVLLAWGTQHAIFGASALTAWRWEYGELTRQVLGQRPQRVFFLYSSNPETLFEAREWWRSAVSEVATIDPRGPSPLDVDAHALGDLREGDWVIERFGPDQNLTVPLRDLQVVRPLDQGLLRSPGTLSVTPVARFRATYPAFFNRPSPHAIDATTFIEWQISKLNRTPHLFVTGLDADQWMHARAELLWRGTPGQVIDLEFEPFLPGDSASNSLFVRAGEHVVAECRAVLRRCSFAAPATGSVDPDGWHRLILEAARVFRPSDTGVSADVRPLSFRVTSVRTAAR